MSAKCHKQTSAVPAVVPTKASPAANRSRDASGWRSNGPSKGRLFCQTHVEGEEGEAAGQCQGPRTRAAAERITSVKQVPTGLPDHLIKLRTRSGVPGKPYEAAA